MREALKAHAIGEALRAKYHEILAAQQAGDSGLARLRRAEAAYLSRARAQAIEARDGMRSAISRGLGELGTEEAAHLEQGRVIDVRPGEVEALRRVLEALRTPGTARPVTRAPHVLRSPRAVRAASQMVLAPSEGTGRGTRAAREEYAEQLRVALARAQVQQAVRDFAHEQLPQASTFPSTALAEDFPAEAERSALEARALQGAPSAFEAGRVAEDGPVTHYTAPDGTVYDIFDPHSVEHPEATRGEGLPLSFDAARRAAEAPGQDRRPIMSSQNAQNIRSQLARRLRLDGVRDAAWLRAAFQDGGTWLQPEPGRDVFTEDDLAAARIGQMEDDRHRAEFDQKRSLHTNVPLPHAARVELLARQLERSGRFTHPELPDVGSAGYDNAASDYVPLLYARAYNVEVHVVCPGQNTLVFHPDTPDSRHPQAQLHQVHVLLDDGTFKALIPRRPTAVPPSDDDASDASSQSRTSWYTAEQEDEEASPSESDQSSVSSGSDYSWASAESGDLSGGVEPSEAPTSPEADDAAFERTWGKLPDNWTVDKALVTATHIVAMREDRAAEFFDSPREPSLAIRRVAYHLLQRPGDTAGAESLARSLVPEGPVPPKPRLRGGTRTEFSAQADPETLPAAAVSGVDVSAITPRPVVWRSTSETLWRTTHEKPEVVLTKGFQPKDPSNTSLLHHVQVGDRWDAFVSTSKRHDIRDLMHEKYPYRLDPYVYEIHAPGGIDVVATMPSNGHYHDEGEIAFPGGINPRFITHYIDMSNGVRESREDFLRRFAGTRSGGQGGWRPYDAGGSSRSHWRGGT